MLSINGSLVEKPRQSQWQFGKKRDTSIVVCIYSTRLFSNSNFWVTAGIEVLSSSCEEPQKKEGADALPSQIVGDPRDFRGEA